MVFVTACESRSSLALLRKEGFEVHQLDGAYPTPKDWDTLREVLSTYPDAWVTTDGYHFDTAYQRLIKESGHPLLVIDDMAHLERYAADIVLNQNLHAAALQYTCEADCRLLLGPRYVLLRREFIERQTFRRDIRASARRILITLGGVDPSNAIFRVLQALQKVEGNDLEIRVVVGKSTSRHGQLEEIADRSPFDTQLVIDPARMSDLMAWADLAISAGGSTCWELAFMGLPNVVVVLSDNQRPIAEHLEAEGVSVNLGWHENLRADELVRAVTSLLGNAGRRTEMARRGQALVDGKGAARVLRYLDDGEGD